MEEETNYVPVWDVTVNREGNNECYYEGELLELETPNFHFYHTSNITEEEVREIVKGTEGIISIDIKQIR